ncbi:MAG: acyltransferase family protein [Rubrivivax sp.]|nr:acyltransferase family protein [Rubrivivax sp.]
MKTTPPLSIGPAAEQPPPARRDFFIDWLRIIALGLLILYHVGMAYVSWGWHVKSAAATPELAALVEPWMRLTAPWRMTLLFVVSGLATALMLHRRRATQGSAGRGWLGQRARRLLLPLLTGMVLIVPVQSYFEVRQFHGFAGSSLDFLRLYFSGYGGFCAPQRGCLVLPTWNHLWFLPYLFAYTALLALVLRRWPAVIDRAAARLTALLAGAGLLLWPLAWFALTRATLKPLFGETHAFVDDLFLHTQYALAFALGVLLAHPAAAPLWPRLQAMRHLALALALLAWALVVVTAPGATWRLLPWSVMQWCAVVAALGYAKRHLQRDGAARRALSAAVFPVYLFHQTVTVAAVAWLAPWQLPAAAEAALLVASTFGLSWAGYEGVRRLARRVPALGPWFGLADAAPRPQRRAAITAPSSA